MSCFQGRMKEYKNITIDRFDEDNLKSTAYFLSHCHEDHTVGLKLPDFHERLRSSVDVFIYCSEVTKILILADDNYKHLEKYVKTLEIGVPHSVLIPDFYSNKTETVNVTLIEAYHCPGSVMFLFEGVEGTVLYTGDFRWESDQALREPAFKSGQNIKEIQSLYIDTTFCSPENFFIPCRQDCVEAVCCMVSEWVATDTKNVIQILLRARYGHEDLLVDVARRMKCKIHVSEEKCSVYEKISDLKDYFTADPEATMIHACNFCPQSPGKVKMKGSLKCGYLPPGGSSDNVMVIVPSTLFFATRSHLSLASIATKKNGIYHTCYTFHSSYSEICDFVSYLRPQKVFPNVKPFKDHSMEEVQVRLNKFLTRTHKSHSIDNAVTKPLGRLKKRKHSRNLENVLTDSEGLVFNMPEKKRKMISSESLPGMKENGLKDKQITIKHTGDGEIRGKGDSDMEYSHSQSSSCRGSIDSGSELDLDLSDPYESDGKAEPVETGHFIESLSQGSGSGSLQLWLSDEEDLDYDDSVENLNHVDHPENEIEKSPNVIAENFNEICKQTDEAINVDENTVISMVSDNEIKAGIDNTTDEMKTDREVHVRRDIGEDTPSDVIKALSSDQSVDKVQNLDSISSCNRKTMIESKIAEPDKLGESLIDTSDVKCDGKVEEDKPVLVSNSDQLPSESNDMKVEVASFDHFESTDDNKLTINDESKVNMNKSTISNAANPEVADRLEDHCEASGDGLNVNSCESVTGNSMDIGEHTNHDSSTTNKLENQILISEKDVENHVEAMSRYLNPSLDTKMASAGDAVRLGDDVENKTLEAESIITENTNMEKLEEIPKKCLQSKMESTVLEKEIGTSIALNRLETDAKNDALPINCSINANESVSLLDKTSEVCIKVPDTVKTEPAAEQYNVPANVIASNRFETDAKNNALQSNCSNNASENVSLLAKTSEVYIKIPDTVKTEPASEQYNVPANGIASNRFETDAKNNVPVNDHDSVIRISNETKPEVDGSPSEQENESESGNKEAMEIDLSQDAEASKTDITIQRTTLEENSEKNDGKPCENTLSVQSGCAVRTVKESAVDACSSDSKTASVEANNGKESDENSKQQNKLSKTLSLVELTSTIPHDVIGDADESQQRNSADMSDKGLDTSDTLCIHPSATPDDSSNTSPHIISSVVNDGTSCLVGVHDVIDVMDCSDVKYQDDTSQGSDVEILGNITADAKLESDKSKSSITDKKQLRECDAGKKKIGNDSSLELFDHDDDSTDGDEYDYLELEKLNTSRDQSNKLDCGSKSELGAVKSNDHQCLTHSLLRVKKGRDSESPVDLTDVSPSKTPMDDDDVIVLSSQNMDSVQDEQKLLQAYNTTKDVCLPQPSYTTCNSDLYNFPITSHENISQTILNRRLHDCTHFLDNSCMGGVRPDMVDNLNSHIGNGTDSGVCLPLNQHSFLPSSSEVINLDSDSDVGNDSDSDTDVAIVSQADYLNGIKENATCGHGKNDDHSSDMLDNTENSQAVIDLTSDEEQF